MRVLVTGGAGFIGYHLVKRLLSQAHEVASIDSINDYYDPTLKRARLAQLESRGNYQFHQMDVNDRDRLKGLTQDLRPDCVVHLAAQAGVRYSIDNPYAYAHSNLDGFLSVLETCRDAGIGHLIYASSSSVYGNDAPVPFTVDYAANKPISLYVATKRANELMAYTYAHLYGMPCTGLRFFTVYGPWGRPDMAYFKFAELMRKGEPITIYNNGDLERDFTYVDDVSEAITRLIVHAPTDEVPHNLFNIGRGQPVNLLEFVEILESELGLEAKKEFVGMQPGDVHSTFADTAPLEAVTGYRPQVTLRAGIREFAGWYREYRGIAHHCN